MRDAVFLKPDVTTSQDLTEDALDFTTSFSTAFKLEQILIRVDTTITETITITLDSNEGENYDVVLVSTRLVGKDSFLYKPTGESNFQVGDNIRIQCTNANKIGEIFAVTKTSEM